MKPFGIFVATLAISAGIVGYKAPDVGPVVNKISAQVSAWWNYDPEKAFRECDSRPLEMTAEASMARVKECQPHLLAWAKRDGKDKVIDAVMANTLTKIFSGVANHP